MGCHYLDEGSFSTHDGDGCSYLHHGLIDYVLTLCKGLHMATNLAIDNKLLNKALKIGGKRTKKDTVNEALKEFIVRREQQKVLDLFGTVEYFDDYEPKKARRL